MTTFTLRVWRRGAQDETLYEESFTGSDFEMERRLSSLWDTHTPVDGSGWTARAYENSRLRHAIGW